LDLGIRKPRFTEGRTALVLVEGDADLPIGALCRKNGISKETHYHQMTKYAGVAMTEQKRVREFAGGERAAQVDVRRSGAGECSDQGCPEPKIVTPAARQAAVKLMRAMLCFSWSSVTSC
jgi:putative transposase